MKNIAKNKRLNTTKNIDFDLNVTTNAIKYTTIISQFKSPVSHLFPSRYSDLSVEINVVGPLPYHAGIQTLWIERNTQKKPQILSNEQRFDLITTIISQ